MDRNLVVSTTAALTIPNPAKLGRAQLSQNWDFHSPHGVALECQYGIMKLVQLTLVGVNRLDSVHSKPDIHLH